MRDALLVLNAGSSSIKFALFESAEPIARQALFSGQIDGIGTHRVRLKAQDASGATLTDSLLDDGPQDAAGQHRHALDCLLGWVDAHDDGLNLIAVGHRVVHGGERYTEPVRLTPDIRNELARLIPLAPLHQPHNLDAIRAVAEIEPQLPQIACFDTAFHHSQPALACAFALPRALSAEGVRRYGFHGISYEYIAESLPEHLGAAADGRVIVAHLGNGASLCALQGRQSMATTMGFTALDGLMMGTRCGNIDPGVLLYLMDHHGMDSPALARLLYKESGLLGVSGISQDMRTLLASTQPAAQEAVELFCYRIVREIGSLAAALGGLDALVFTGGIGEHAAPVRQKVCDRLAWLGAHLDPAANAVTSHGQPRSIHRAGADLPILVMPTHEEWMIARHTHRLR
jgi:acetate kinase